MIECSINNLTKYYGANKIFENISFDVKSGERIGLIGQNGCGKTTIMKIIMGIEDYQEGSVSIRKGARVGYLDQIPGYEKSITAMDILYLAFDELFKIKEELKEIEESLKVLQDEALEKALKTYGDISEKYERLGGYEVDTKISKITEGLKIDEKMKGMSFDLLSGGEKTRVVLGKILLEQPDILMLDEPSNHLDMDSIEWLEEFLKEYKGTVLIISHDRYFLDRVVNKIVELEFSKAIIYHGNYSYYTIEKERRFIIDLKFYMNQQKKIKNMERQIERYRIWGVMRDSDKMFRRAKELEKRLEKVDRVDKPILEKRKIKLNTEHGKRSGKQVLIVEGLSKRFDDKILFDNVNFNVQFQESICIVGKNGSGKSTLLKIVLNELSADRGTVKIGANVKIGYLSQNVTFDDESKTILEYFQYRHDLTIGETRSALARVLFVKDDCNKKISSLSGGEKSRLKLCSLLYEKINFMILDEPTNHLDIDSREVLEDLLMHFDGTILFVSHDRYFITKVASKMAEIEYKKLIVYNGDYDYYKYEKQKALNCVSNSPRQVKEDTVKPQNKKVSKSNKPNKYTLQKIKDIEEIIENIENKLSHIEDDMLVHGNDVDKLNELLLEKNNLQSELQQYYEKWEQLQ